MEKDDDATIDGSMVEVETKDTITKDSIDSRDEATEEIGSGNGGKIMHDKGKKKGDIVEVLKDKVSLQDRFSRFRNERLHKNKEKVELRKQSALKRTDPEFKQKLREKFIEHTKKYYGVPYKKKYHEEGTELYNSKLFLDCCGLIRQVLRDLKDDFGFKIGPYNQNYQFETLPIVLKFEEMKPGDIIFYEATYFEKSRQGKQVHNLTHVEVFMGGETGEQSIGARWFKGVVKLFDSYKFESTTYYDIKFHYRSLDTWLEGICKSHFPNSRFGTTLQFDVNKHSLFLEDDESDDGGLMDIPAHYETVDKIAYVCAEYKEIESILEER